MVYESPPLKNSLVRLLTRPLSSSIVLAEAGIIQK